MTSGKLILVATPIGNLGDLSDRARKALEEAEIWIVEDTRVSAKLQFHLGLKRPMRVLNDHTSEAQVERLANELADKITALVTDGGTPAISDPGAHLTDLAVGMGIEIDAIPGPSAVTTALMLSGFYAQRFVFLGFLARKPSAIRSDLAAFKDSSLTIVLFESPHRALATLKLAFEALGDRRFALCREMTKLHQEVVRGQLATLESISKVEPKGEVCIVLEGRRRRQSADNNDVLE